MFLGLDLGTTNIKAVLVDEEGRILARGAAPVRLMHVGRDGIEQDIDEIWSATLLALQRLSEAGDVSRVKAMGVSAQGGAIQLLDGEGRTLGRVISWLDGRGRPYDLDAVRKFGKEWFADHIGHGRGSACFGQWFRLRKEHPELLRRPNRIGFVGDVIVFRLCGAYAHDATSLSLAMMYNPRLRAADPEMLRLLDVGEDQLPRLMSARTPAGGLVEEVAARTSLPPGIPVSPAVHDQYAAALAAAVVHPGDVMFGAGTAWVLLAATDELTRPVTDSALVCTHVVQGLYGQMLSLTNGGSSFGWAKEVLGLTQKSGEELDAMIESVPPGSGGVRFWPLLAPGGGAGLVAGTRGRLMGLQLGHKASHILRAVAEGLALELGRYLRMLTEAGIELERLVMCGGAAMSRTTPQLVADATGLPVACATEPEMSALGGAVIARGVAEPNADFVWLSEVMTAAVRVFEPGSNAAFYKGLLEEYIASLPRVES